jgi:DNA polymerase III epsilon subunit family exonuclease
MAALDEVPFVAFDTETTGLHDTDRLVELAAVRFRGGQVEAEWSVLVDPGVPIPPAATAVHGLTDSDVAGRETAAEVLPAFLDFVQGAALVAHNAPFDLRVLALELLRAGLPLPDQPVVDTCALSRLLPVSVPNHRLGTLADAFGVARGRPHRALSDARVAKDLLRAYLRELGPAADVLVRRHLTQDGLRLSLRCCASEPVPETPLVALVRRARAEGRALSISCGSPDRAAHLEPRDVYAVGGSVYVEAGCTPDGAVRTFRAADIHAARLA